MCCENKFCCSETKNVFAWSPKHFCFPDTNFAFETYVSQFSHPGKHNRKHCFRNNVSLFSQALMMARERCQPMESLHEVILLRRGCHVPRDYTTFINTTVRNFYLYYVIQNKQKVVFGQVNTVYYLKYC